MALDIVKQCKEKISEYKKKGRRKREKDAAAEAEEVEKMNEKENSSGKKKKKKVQIVDKLLSCIEKEKDSIMKESAEKETTESEKCELDDSKARIAALEYLKLWKCCKAQWKFKKTRQVYLLKHMYDPHILAKENFAILLEYLQGLPENSAGRQTTVQNAKLKFEEMQTLVGNSDPLMLGPQQVEPSENLPNEPRDHLMDETEIALKTMQKIQWIRAREILLRL